MTCSWFSSQSYKFALKRYITSALSRNLRRETTFQFTSVDKQCLMHLSFPVSRQQIDTKKQVFEEKTESCSDIGNTRPLTKHVDLSDENVDKACLSVSRAVPVGENVVHLAMDQVNLRPVGDGEWSDIQATEARIADVREIAPETEGSSLDIPVVSLPVNNHHEQGANSFHQP